VRSLVELVVAVVPFVALWLLMLASLRYSYWSLSWCRSTWCDFALESRQPSDRSLA
jgi:hypothetical protein